MPPHALAAREQRDGAEQHITIANHKEMKRLLAHSSSNSAKLNANAQLVLEEAAARGLVDPGEVIVRGLGTARKEGAQCWFVVLDWPAARAWPGWTAKRG